METNELENQNEQVNDQANDQVADQVNEQVNEEVSPVDSPWFSAYGYENEDSFKTEFEQLKSYKGLAQQLAEKQRDIEEGLALAKAGAALHQESFDSQYMVVDMLEQNQRWSEALPYRKRTTELDPMNWNVWMAYARNLENTGDKAGAKIALNKVLEFTNDPKFIADAKNSLASNCLAW